MRPLRLNGQTSPPICTIRCCRPWRWSRSRRPTPPQWNGWPAAQERQLRTWLYRHKAEALGTLKDQIGAVAAELEEMHHLVPVDVVAVGDSRRTLHEPLVAASREAILNALKHAGPASVYIESTDDQDAVFDRDPAGRGSTWRPSARTGWGCALRSSGG